MSVESFQERVRKKDEQKKESTLAKSNATNKEKAFVNRVESSKESKSNATKNYNIASEILNPQDEANAYEYSNKNKTTLALAREASKIPEMVRVFPSNAAQQSPSIGRYFDKDLNNAGVSHGDMDSLLSVERAVNNRIPGFVGVDGEILKDVEGVPLWKAFAAPEETREMTLGEKSKRAFDVGQYNLTLNQMRYNQIFVADTPESEEAIDTFKKRIPSSVTGKNIIEDIVIATSGMTPLVLDTIKESQTHGLAGASAGTIAGAAAGPATIIPTATLGYSAGTSFGAMQNIYIQETGAMFDELVGIRDESGQPIDREVLKAFSIGYGVFSTILESKGLEYILKAFPGGSKIIGRLTKEPAKKILKSVTVRKALLQIAKNIGLAAGVEGFTEGAQKAGSIVARELAKIYAEEKEGAYFLPIDWKNVFREIGTDAYHGAAGGIGFAGMGSVPSAAKIPFDVNRTKKQNTQMRNTKDAADQTKTISLSPDKAEQFMEETELPPEGNLIPDETLFQVDGIEEMFRKIGVDPREARKALAAGQDVPIPNAKILAQLTKEEMNTVLAYIQPAPDGYTEKQISEKVPQADAEQLKETHKDSLADALEFGKELDRIKGEIIAVDPIKFTPEVAETNTEIVERFANGLKLQGADRTAFLKNLEFKRTPFLQRALDKGKALFQEPAEATDKLLREQIVELTSRREQFEKRVKDITTPEAQEFIAGLDERIAVAEQKQKDRAFLAFDTLYQAQKVDPKAAIDFIGDKFIISLFEKADVSSIQHELSHAFLRQMTSVEDIEGITDQFKGDMGAIRKWLGAEKGEAYTVEQDEQFARGWEKWLREGKAPNAQLYTVFARFKTWLEEIYKKARSLDVDLPDSIRSVFNRMLDADNEAQAAAGVNNMVPATTDRMNSLGIPNDTQIKLKGLGDQAVEKAGNLLFTARNKAVRENSKRFIAESEREIHAEDRPGEVFGVYDMVDDIKDNKLQFSRSEYNEAAGSPNAYKFLPAKNLTTTREKARTLDDTAKAYGFDSADALVESLATTLPFETAVSNRVDQKVKALDATFNVEDFLADTQEWSDYIQLMGDQLRKAEGRAVRGGEAATGRKAVAREQLRVLAQSTIDEMSVRNSQRVDRFMAAQKRAGLAQANAEKKGDLATAIRENEKMQLNYEMGMIASRNKKFVRDTIKNAAKFTVIGKPPGVSSRFREGVRSVIEKFSMIPRVAPQNPVSSSTFDKLLKGDQFTGEFIASDFLKSDKIRDYREIPLVEFKEVDNAIRYLETQGRDEKSQVMADGKTKLRDKARPMLAEMDAQKAVTKLDKHNMLKGVVEGSDEWFSRMFNLSYITKALGGYKSLTGGPSLVEQGITEVAKDLRDNQLTKFRAVREEIQPDRDHILNAMRRIIKHNEGNIRRVFGKVGAVKHSRKLFVRDNNVPVPNLLQDNGSQRNYWEPEQIFAMAFNRGNESNTQALLNGYPGLTIEQVDSLLNQYLTKEDIDAVQNIINAINKLAPETDAVHVRLKGYHMDRVEPRPWIFKGKTYDGGYYPLVIDRALATVEHDVFSNAAEEADYYETADKTFVVPFAKNQHTLSRKDGHGLPVDLRLVNIDKHIDKSIRYITMAEGIRDLDRIINYKENVVDIDELGEETKRTLGFKASAVRIMGENVYNQLRPALKHFVNPVLEGVDTPGNKFIGMLRSIAVPAHIALKTITGVKQLASISSGIHDLGKDGKSGLKKWVNGIAIVTSNASAAYQTMLNKSAFMKERLKSWERDFLKSRFDRMTPAQREFSFGDKNISWKQVIDAGYITVRIPDIIAVTPLWWGGYQAKIDEGATEKDAVRYADNIIEDTQPTAQPLDLSAWFREGGYWSMFNLHQTFTVGNYGQRQRTWFRAWKRGDLTAGKYAFFNFMDAVLPLTLMNVLISYLRGGDLADEEEQKEIIGDILFGWAFMGIPMATSAWNALWEGWLSPLEVAGAREVEKSAQTIRLIGKGFTEGMSNAEEERAIWGLAEIISLALRIPVAQVAKQLLEGETIKEKAFKPKKQ